MVETNQSIFTHQSASFPYNIEEQSLVGKTGNDEECEDAIYIGPSFVAVIDGATSKTDRQWDGRQAGELQPKRSKRRLLAYPLMQQRVRQSTFLLRDQRSL